MSANIILSCLRENEDRVSEVIDTSARIDFPPSPLSPGGRLHYVERTMCLSITWNLSRNLTIAWGFSVIVATLKCKEMYSHGNLNKSIYVPWGNKK